jgi:hypothetical protein
MAIATLSRAVFAVVAGVAAGLASAHWAMSLQTERAGLGGTVWRVTATAEPQINPYALAASLAEFRLPPPQSLEFVASRDSEGRTLYGDCSYRLRLPAPTARWWTVQLLPSGDRSFATSHMSIAGPSGIATLAIARAPQPGNWISPAEAAPFRIVLTVAAPPRELAGEPMTMGDIERIGCG